MNPGRTSGEPLERLKNQTFYFNPPRISYLTRANVDSAVLAFYRLGTDIMNPEQRKEVCDYLEGRTASPPQDIAEFAAIEELEMLSSLRPKNGGLTSQQKKRLRGLLEAVFSAGIDMRGTELAREADTYFSEQLAHSQRVVGFAGQVAEARRVLSSRPCGEPD